MKQYNGGKDRLVLHPHKNTLTFDFVFYMSLVGSLSAPLAILKVTSSLWLPQLVFWAQRILH